MRDGWIETTLGEVMDEVKTKVRSPWDAGVDRYVGLEHFDSGSPSLQRWGSPGDVKSSKTVFAPGDILFGKLRPYLRKVAVARWPGICSTDVLALRARTEKITPGYLLLLLSSDEVLSHAISTSKGTRMPRTSYRDLASVPVSLPPLAEQRRIVDLIESVDRAFAATQQLRRASELARRSLLVEKLERSTTFEPTRLRDITTKIGSGATPRGGESSYKSFGISLIRSQNVHDNRFVYAGLARIDDDQAASLSNVEVREDDVLLNITGASVARCCSVPRDVLPARVNQHVAIIRADRDKVMPQFIEAWLTAPEQNDRLLAIAEAGTTRQALTKATIGDLLIPLPPLPSQKQIAETMAAFGEVSRTADLYLSQHSNTRGALVSDLLSGDHEIPVSYDRLLEPAS